MSAFIAWVYAQAPKVYSWFGDAYASLYNGAKNAWSWAVSQANSAYSRAVNYAYALLQGVQSDLSGVYDWVISQISTAYSGLSDDISGLFDWVEWKLSNIQSFVTPIVTSSLQSVYDLINSIPLSFHDFVNGMIEDVRTWVNDGYSWILSLRDSLTTTLTNFTPSIVTFLIALATTWYTSIITFLQNPLTFILDIIQKEFISFACYVLAWGMGATKSDLPNTPPWRK